MLLLGSKLLNYPIMSLQIGDEIGRTESPIIDPVKLKIIAYHLSGPLIDDQEDDTLMTEDIREFSKIGLIIDDAETLINPADVIRIQEILKINFRLIGHKVVTKQKKSLGRVVDYTIDTSTFSIYQLIVRRPLLSGLNDPELTINRSQILEIDDEKVIIKHDKSMITIEPLKTGNIIPSYTNPFRTTKKVPAESSDQN